MAAIIGHGVQTVKDKFHPYLDNNVLSLPLSLLERVLHIDRVFIALGLTVLITFYLVFGWGNEALCHFLALVYPVFATISVIRSRRKKDNKYLLLFWMVYCTFDYIEYFFRQLQNSATLFYVPLKLIFLIWFMASGSKLTVQIFGRKSTAFDEDDDEDDDEDEDEDSSDDTSDNGGPPSVIPPAAPLSLSLSEEDIRLCTINRADETDIFGFELNFHRRQRFHSLSISSGRDDKPSNAALAGIQANDRVIEINGQNIQELDHAEVTKLIRSTKYPQPLQLLVADVPTYEYYRQQKKTYSYWTAKCENYTSK